MNNQNVSGRMNNKEYIHTYGKQVSTKKCRCGSTTHSRTTSKDCLLRKSKQRHEDVYVSNVSDYSSSGENPIDTPSEHSCDEVVESSDDEGQVWCICQGRGSLYGDMAECCNKSSAVKWFHLHCMSLGTAPKGD